jgi:membrane protein
MPADFNLPIGPTELLLWFYVTSIAILVGAELNAEIEHASPYGKAPGEKVPRMKKKIGIAARRYFEARRAKGLAS